MSAELLSFVLDIFVLVFLGITIYYAMRLSKNLKAFRVQRKEMKGLVDELSRNITLAQSAVEALKSSGKSSGANLREQINEAAALTDELQLMNEAGNNLAKRLENLAERNSRLAQSIDVAKMEEPEIESSVANAVDEPFLIQDRDFEDSSEETESGWGDDDLAGDVPDELHSQAEQELYRALQRNQKKKSAGGGR